MAATYSKPTIMGVIFGALVGFIPVFLAICAMAFGQISYKLKIGEWFLAKRNDDPIFFWAFFFGLLFSGVVIWIKTIIDLTFVIREKKNPGKHAA